MPIDQAVTLGKGDGAEFIGPGWSMDGETSGGVAGRGGDLVCHGSQGDCLVRGGAAAERPLPVVGFKMPGWHLIAVDALLAALGVGVVPQATSHRRIARAAR